MESLKSSPCSRAEMHAVLSCRNSLRLIQRESLLTRLFFIVLSLSLGSPEDISTLVALFMDMGR
jgi:hypothetical protein